MIEQLLINEYITEDQFLVLKLLEKGYIPTSPN